MARLTKILTTAFDRNASDIHITVGSVPIFRIDGNLIEHKESVMKPDDTKAMARSILSSKLWERLQREREVDLSWYSWCI